MRCLILATSVTVRDGRHICAIVNGGDILGTSDKAECLSTSHRSGKRGEWLAGATTLKAFLSKVLGPATGTNSLESFRMRWPDGVKSLATRREKRFLRISSSAAQQVDAAGVVPVQIPDYIILPLLESATLVDDESLQEKWAALLANAVGPGQSRDSFSCIPEDSRKLVAETGPGFLMSFLTIAIEICSSKLSQ